MGGVQEGHGPDVRNRARCSLSQPRLRPAATTLCSFTRVPGGEPPSGDHGSSDSHRELRRWRLGFLSRCFPQLPTQGAPQPGVPPCAGGPGVQSSPSTASATVTQPPFPGGWSPFWIPAEAMTTEDPARAWASEAGDEHSSLPTQPQPAGGGGLAPPSQGHPGISKLARAAAHVQKKLLHAAAFRRLWGLVPCARHHRERPAAHSAYCLLPLRGAGRAPSSLWQRIGALGPSEVRETDR